MSTASMAHDLDLSDAKRRVLFQQAFFFSREVIVAVQSDFYYGDVEPMQIWLRVCSSTERADIEQVAPGFFAAFEDMVALLIDRSTADKSDAPERQAKAVEAMNLARNQMLKLPVVELVGRQPRFAADIRSHPAHGRWADKSYTRN